MSFITTKFQVILLCDFRGVALTRKTVVSFIFVNFEVQKERYTEKKNWIKISCGYAYVHIMSFITTEFQEILSSSFRGVAMTNCFSSVFHFWQISKLTKGATPRKKNESKFHVDMHIYMVCPSQLRSLTKFCWVVSEELRWQEKQDWRTDWQTGQKHYTLRNSLCGV